MSCEVKLIRKDQFKTSVWSGGTTTQLAIYPKDALYSERNFKWRLSSAKVEEEESVFTLLPGINRIIMILDGKLILEHEGHHSCILKPFEIDSFSGSWKTKSYGKVTDFNLMMSAECEGELEEVHLEKGKSKTIKSGMDEKRFLQNTKAIYCINGSIQVKTSDNDVLNLCEGDLALLTLESNIDTLAFSICNSGDKQADMVVANIRY